MSGEALVLVTGASGYVATHVIQQLQKAGHKVRGTVRSVSNEEKVKPLHDLCPGAVHPLQLVEADLDKPDTWEAAVAGCTYVIHLASPFPAKSPRDEGEVIRPAVDGTLSVLRACSKVGGVKRVVLTSSLAAVSNGFDKGGHFSEEDWTDVTEAGSPYIKSKTLAEKAAWDYMAELPAEEAFELAVINPGYILGPVLCGGWATSLELPKMLLEREIPLLPHICFGIIDVRQCAEAHIKAMTHPDAAGKRHILSPHTLWVREVAEIYREVFRPLGYNIPMTEAPYCIMKVYSLCDARVKQVIKQWGKESSYDQTRMTSVLNIDPKPARETILDMAHSMVEKGFVKETEKYSKMKQQ